MDIIGRSYMLITSGSITYREETERTERYGYKHFQNGPDCAIVFIFVVTMYTFFSDRLF